MRSRRATQEDLPAVAKLHRLAFFEAMPEMPVLHTPEEDLAFYSAVVVAESEIWVSESDGEMLGFIAFRSGWVDQLYIHPEHQRRGLGGRLLAVAMDRQAEVRLWTFQCNAKARAFYERHGFRIERETDGIGNEEKQPDLLLLWERGAANLTARA